MLTFLQELWWIRRWNVRKLRRKGYLHFWRQGSRRVTVELDNHKRKNQRTPKAEPTIFWKIIQDIRVDLMPFSSLSICHKLYRINRSKFYRKGSILNKEAIWAKKKEILNQQWKNLICIISITKTHHKNSSFDKQTVVVFCSKIDLQ